MRNLVFLHLAILLVVLEAATHDFKTSQYQTLRKEVERLKVCYINHLKSKTTVCRRTGSAIDAIISDSSWQMLDIGKLSLGEN
uniref:Uncharacterized protein n=1 Tax=Nelumbo nucifera TaxID=4432 RepID=A0A822ZSZ4_NELNU|nr:TPA_asm: hypothetical protein HUJ06_018309 [Nelumbo nucifera]